MGATTMDKPTTDLVPANAGARALITSQAAYEQQLQRWQQEQVHALCPMVDFGALPEQYALVPAKVKIDPNPNMGEVYSGHFCSQNEVALTAIGLQKIAACAGISLYTKRTDPRNIPHYWEFQAVASWIGFDGARQTRSATKEWDLRDGSEQIKGFTDKQKSEARKHGARNAETRAINAVIRQLGVKQKYTVQELQKPFGLVRVVFQPNMNDPVQRAVVAQQALGGTAALYPPTGVPAITGDVIDGQIADEPAPVSKAAAVDDGIEDVAPATTTTAPAPTPTRYTVAKVLRQPREEQKLAPIYFVQTQPQETFHTEDEALAKAAASAKRDGVAIEIDAERRGEALWILELRRLDGPPANGVATTLPPGACYVEDITKKSGVTPGKGGKADRPWTKRTVVFSTGESGVTFSDTIAATAEEAKAKRLPVKPTFEENPNYPDQQTLTGLSLVDTAQRSFLESEL